MISFLHNNNSNFNSHLVKALFLLFLLVFGYVNPMAIVFAYVFETVSIGIIHFIKLFFVIRNMPAETGSTKKISYATMPFFLVHYGAFVAVQTIFIYEAFAINDNRFSTSLSWSTIKVIFQLEGFYLVAASIIVSQIAGFYFSFIKNKKYLNQKLASYFMKPYLRIFIQQLLAIVPFFFLYFSNKVGIIAAVLLIVLRTVLDLVIAYVSGSEKQFDKVVLFLADKTKPEDIPEFKESLRIFFEE